MLTTPVRYLIEILPRLTSQIPNAPRTKISTTTIGTAKGVTSATGSSAGAAVRAGVGWTLLVANGVADATADDLASVGDGDGDDVGVGDGKGVGVGVGDGGRVACGVALGLVVGVGVGSSAAAGHLMTNVATPGKSLAENEAFVPADPTRVAATPRCVVNRSPGCSTHPRVAAEGAV